MAHDELDGWDDDELVAVLRAPGTPAELADEGDFVAAFRAHQSRGSVRRAAGRFGLGATTIVTTIALTGGVAAAAYTQTLPDPVQRFAHGVLGPVGVPAPDVERSPARKPAAPTPQRAATTAPAAPTPTVPEPGSPSVAPTAGTVPAVPPTGAPATAAPPVETPGAPAPRPTPSALTSELSAARVAYSGTVSVSGVLTAADGSPLRGRTIRLATRVPGQPWSRATVGRTDPTGRVVLTTPGLTQNTAVRLSTPQGLRSPVLRVLVVPVVRATSDTTGPTTTIAVTTQGGVPGDTVVAYRRKGTTLVKVGTATLDAEGRASVQIATPQRSTRFVVRLLASSRHGRAQTGLSVAGARPPGPSQVPETAPEVPGTPVD